MLRGMVEWEVHNELVRTGKEYLWPDFECIPKFTSKMRNMVWRPSQNFRLRMRNEHLLTHAYSFTAKLKLFSGEFCIKLTVALSELQTFLFFDKITEKLWAKITGNPGCHICEAWNLPTENRQRRPPSHSKFLSQEGFNGLQQRFVADRFTLTSVKLNSLRPFWLYTGFTGLKAALEIYWIYE